MSEQMTPLELLAEAEMVGRPLTPDEARICGAALAAAGGDRDEAIEHLREVLMWDDQGVWNAANDWLAALATPERKARDE